MKNEESKKIHPIRKLIRFIGALFAIYFFGNIVFMIGWGFYANYDSNKMCDEISNLNTPTDIIKYAKNNERPYFEYPEKETMTVLNHRPYFFRQACNIKIKNGQLMQTTLRGAD